MVSNPHLTKEKIILFYFFFLFPLIKASFAQEEIFLKLFSREIRNAQTVLAELETLTPSMKRRCIKQLIPIIEKGKPEVYSKALYSLIPLAPESYETLPFLIKIIEGKDPFKKEIVLKIVAHFGTNASCMVPSLLAHNLQFRDKIQFIQVLVRLSSHSKEMNLKIVNFLTESLKSGEQEWGVRRELILALGKLGKTNPSVVPILVKALQDSSPKVAKAAAFALGELKANEGIIELKKLLSTHSYYQDSLIRCLGKFGPAAKTVVPELIVRLKNKNWRVRKESAETLGKIGKAAKAAIPALIATLKDTKSVVRYWAIWALGEIGEEAKEASPALFPLLTSLKKITLSSSGKSKYQIVSIREVSANSLSKIVPELLSLEEVEKNLRASLETKILFALWVFRKKVNAWTTIQIQNNTLTIVALTKSEYPEIRKNALILLSQILEEMDLKIIRSGLKDPNAAVRIAALQILQKVKKNKELLPELFSLLQEAPNLAQLTILQTLAAMHLTSEELSEARVKILIEQLKSKNEEVQKKAQEILAKNGEASYFLSICRNAKERDLRLSMLRILVQMNKDTVLSEILTLLTDKTFDDEMFQHLLQILTNSGSKAQRATQTLIQLFQEKENTTIRKAILTTLKKINPKLLPLLPFLIKALNDNENEVCEEAAYLIGTLGLKASKATKELSALFKKKKLLKVIWALGEVGESSETLVELLLPFINDNLEIIRIETMKAMSKICLRASKPLVKIGEGLKDKRANYLCDLLLLLGTMKEKATPYQKEIIALTKHKKYYVRYYSAWCLGKISLNEEASLALVSLTNEHDPLVYFFALNALMKSPNSIPFLQKGLSHQEPFVQKQCQKVLQIIEKAKK